MIGITRSKASKNDRPVKNQRQTDGGQAVEEATVGRKEWRYVGRLSEPRNSKQALNSPIQQTE